MNTPASFRLIRSLSSTALVITFLVNMILPVQARIEFQDDVFNNFDSDGLKIGSNDAGASDTSIRFGADATASENGNMTWNISSNTFSLDHTLNITGGLSANGQVNFSASTGDRLRESANPTTSAACTVTNEVIINTTLNRMEICTVPGIAGAATWIVPDAGSLDGLDSLQFLRSDVSDNYTGGTLTFDGGTTVTVNGNATIGDGGDTIAVNSSTWSVSGPGVASGLTGVTSTGTIDFTAATNFKTPQGAADPGTCSVGQQFYNTTGNQLKICTATNTWTTLSTGTQDFESVYATDGDKVLTTSNAAFTVNTGTNDFIVDSNDWNVTAAGALDASTVTSNGLLTGSAGATISGAATSINASSNFATNIGTGTTTSQVSLGGNANCVAVDSNTWDISCAGVGSGFTGFSTSGTLTSSGTLSGTGAINFSTATSCLPPQASSDPGTCTVGQQFYNTTSNKMKICTATNTWSILANGTIDFEAVYAADGDATLTTTNAAFTVNTGTNDLIVDSNDWSVTAAGALDAATITSNGALTATGTTNLNGAANFNGTTTIGDNGDTVSVNSSDWDISTTGAMTGIGAITMDGLLTGTAGATITGATTSINASSNFATNIGTGTTTSQVSLGGNAYCVAVDSNTWDISCAGVGSGFTGFSTSGTLTSSGTLSGTGTINFSTATSFLPPQASSDPGTCTVGQQFYNTTSNLMKVCTATNTWTALLTGNPDFEGVYAADGDDTLTTSNAAFTIATGTNDFIVDSNDWNVTSAGALDAATITSNGTLTATGTTNLNGAANFNGTTTIGDNGDTVAVNSSDWDISTTGAMTGIGAITMDGLLTGTAGATLSGATINLNASSNNNVNINTGTSTGTIALGNASSTTTELGILNASGVARQRIRESATPNTSAACTTLNEIIMDTTEHITKTCTTVGVAGVAVWTTGGSTGGNYTAASDATTQTLTTLGTFKDITFATNDQLDGWTHTASTANFTAGATGLYLVSLRAGMYNAGSDTTFTGQLRARNSTTATEVPGSNVTQATRDPGSHYSNVTTTFVMSVTAADVITFQFNGNRAGSGVAGNMSIRTQPATPASVGTVKSANVTIIRLK